MLSAKKIKGHYQLTLEEEEILKGLQPMMKEHRDRFTEDFYIYLMSQEDMAEFFPSDEKLQHHKMLISAWFTRLFSGIYDEAYFRNLSHVGKIHVNINLDGHLVNAAMTRVRQFVIEIIDAHIGSAEREKALVAANKILDINLDIMTSSYRAAELNKYFLSARVESALISWIERFTHGLNLVLALALGIVSIGVVGLFVHDIASIFTSSEIENSIVAALGSLLIIWLMIELLDTEIHHLKGRKLQIKVFIGVVIVAFIRKVLVSGFSHEDLIDKASKVGTLLVLGIVYWLVSKAEKE